jgi:hypothetical protein
MASCSIWRLPRRVGRWQRHVSKISNNLPNVNEWFSRYLKELHGQYYAALFNEARRAPATRHPAPADAFVSDKGRTRDASRSGPGPGRWPGDYNSCCEHPREIRAHGTATLRRSTFNQFCATKPQGTRRSTAHRHASVQGSNRRWAAACRNVRGTSTVRLGCDGALDMALGRGL